MKRAPCGLYHEDINWTWTDETCPACSRIADLLQQLEKMKVEETAPMNRAEQWMAVKQQMRLLEPIFRILDNSPQHGSFEVRLDSSLAGLVLRFNGLLMASDVPKLIQWLQETFEDHP